MRIYSAEALETLRARKLLKEWSADGLLTTDQYARLEQETPSDLRTTNIFLRGVLFFFTLIVIAAGTALFSVIFLRNAPLPTIGILLLLLALVCYAVAEMAVAQARLYRHGVEEALLVCSIAFLFAGLEFSQGPHSFRETPAQALIPAICGAVALWIWHRFGYWYAFLAAMSFAVTLPGYWTTSHSAQHAMVAAIFLAGLLGLVATRPHRRFDYLQSNFALAEALLWSGLYLALNLKLSPSNLALRPWSAGTDLPASAEFGNAFYWCTWVLIWCLPPIILARGIGQKDRFVIAVGILSALLTLATNKPYLGWPRHTWDPMLLGIFLTAAVIFIQRWLARGPAGIREGFTAARLSGRDKARVSLGATAFGLLTPQSITPGPQTGNSDLPANGGASGGGGASLDF